MDNFILRRSTRILFPALLILSIIVLYRGHNLPGGGFIGGLMAATAFILVGISNSMDRARALLRIEPVTLMAWGLAVAVVSGLPGLMSHGVFMTGLWLPDFTLPLLGKVHLGTPLVFDIGVFMVVIGFTLHATFSLAKLCATTNKQE